MLPTHVVVGLAVAAPLAVLAPELAPVALWGVLAGSVLPDLDMYVGHRRTLHYPTGYTAAAVVAAFAAVLLVVSAPGTVAGVPAAAGPVVAVAFLFVGAALHCRMDRYGGGLELRPWEATSDRAVYDHVRGRWRAPKRWIRYDGAPEDLLLAAAVGVPLVGVLGDPFRWAVAAALVVGVTYALLRRRLAAVAPTVVDYATGHLSDGVAGPVEPFVPERYRE